jgi:hypothetical protein
MNDHPESDPSLHLLEAAIFYALVTCLVALAAFAGAL